MDSFKEILEWVDNIHEEADNRFLIHIKDMFTTYDLKKILIRTGDTDVVILLVAFFSQF